jgi:hypothetical protein
MDVESDEAEGCVMISSNQVKGSEKLLSRFGVWPSFHDSEVVSFSMVRDEGQPLFSPALIFALGALAFFMCVRFFYTRSVREQHSRMITNLETGFQTNGGTRAPDGTWSFPSATQSDKGRPSGVPVGP